ncbi:MAG: polyphosphate kinase 1 [Thalassobius sp.]|nr:polyphosphate kinase 1 [Thalassovita sp.]
MRNEESTSVIDETSYFNRDLSWLSFNKRLLIEASDPRVPLYERVKFLAIYSSNLDEFFRVRVAAIQSLGAINKKKINKNLGFEPKELLQLIHQEVDKQQQEFGRIFREELMPALSDKGIILYDEVPTSEIHKKYITSFFRSKVLAYLQPVLFKPENKTPFLENRCLYFIVELCREDTPEEVQYGLVNIPSNDLDRFLQLPELNGKQYFIFLDDVIKMNLQTVFPGFKVKASYSVKINRDADLQIEDEYEGDLIEKISKHLSKRNIGPPSRFLYDSVMPESMLTFLTTSLNIENEEIVSGGKYHNFYDFFSLPNPLKPALQEKKYMPIEHQKFEEYDSFFDAMDKEDLIFHFPYQSYDNVLRFFNESAIDPYVEEIKVTVYRIASNSLIANALISAAKNGKKVSVFVEVKARFDEANNLRWAAEMEKAGVEIYFSIPGLKVHAKIALVTRIKDGVKKRYAFYGTGNFNEKTATIYADHGLFSADEEMNLELKSVFRFLGKRNDVPELKHLLVAQVNLQERFLEAIENEIEIAKSGNKAYILIKLNNLEDKVMIDKLYEASQAGVKIDLIIRGICCLRPGLPGISENIKVKRIVDMYLEHARAFLFYNNGNNDLYLGSSDWMRRNLYRRIEVCYPIYNEEIKKEILHILDLQLNDDAKAVILDADMENIRLDEKTGIRAQVDIYNWLKEIDNN